MGQTAPEHHPGRANAHELEMRAGNVRLSNADLNNRAEQVRVYCPGLLMGALRRVSERIWDVRTLNSRALFRRNYNDPSPNHYC